MAFTYIIYTSLLFIMCLCTYYIVRFRTKSSILFIPIIFYSIVIGLRYETGADWSAYKNIFIDILHNNDVNLEYAYMLLNRFIASLHMSYQYLFITIAFLQITLLYLFLEHHKHILFWGTLFFFILGPFFSSLNILRQSIAFFIFLNSIRYIVEKDWKRYFIGIIIAFGFHSSSLILLPMYFINRINNIYLKKQVILSLFFILSILLGEIIIEKSTFYFFQLVDIPQYSRYAIGFEDNTFSYGIGFWCIKIIDFTLIFYASKLGNTFKKEGFPIIWWIYYIGVLIFNLGMANQLIIRLSYCMTSLRFIILSFLCYYTFSMVRCKTKLITCITILILTFGFFSFYSSIAQGHNGCSPFKFAL